MATFIHFDLSAKDLDRARSFYSKLFGWKFTHLPGPVGYDLIDTGTANGTSGLGGGMSLRDAGQRPGITNYIGVDDIDRTRHQVVEMGGRIIREKQHIPGWGHIMLCADPDGNEFGLFQGMDDSGA